MKKYITAAAAIVVLTLVGATVALPSVVPVERKITIEAPPSQVTPYVHNLKNWEKWSPWLGKDPEMKLSYSEQVEGVGASYSWRSASQGEGNMTVVAVGPDTFETALDFGRQGRAKAAFTFTALPGGNTEVTWHMDAQMGNNPVGKIFGLFMDRMVGPDFENGLRKLKALAEANEGSETLSYAD